MIKIKQNCNWLLNANDNSIAVTSSEKRFYYSDLKTDSLHAAALLIANGFTKGSFIPILMDNSYHFIISIFASWHLGAVPVPFNIRLTESEINTNLRALKTNIIVSNKNNNFQNIQTIDITSFKTFNKLENVNIPYRPEETALILFTSGTTGSSKGVIHSFNSLYHSVVNTDCITKTSSDDRWLASLPFYHIGGFMIILRALLTDSQIILPDSLSTDSIIRSLQNSNPTIISLVPTLFQRFIDHNIKAPVSLKKIFIGGSASTDDLISSGIKHGWPLVKVYGSSETGAMISAIEGEELQMHPSASGKPINNTEIQISGIDGEILVKSCSLFNGYLNNSYNPFNHEGFFHTGDFGYIDFNGFLYVEMRREDLIISGSENVNPAEVEKAIMELGNIDDVCVFPIDDKEWGQLVCAAVVSRFQLQADQLLTLLKEKLAGYKVPKKIFFIEAIPKTALGKAKRDELKKSFN